MEEQIYVSYTHIRPESAPFYHKDIFYERFDGYVEYMRGFPQNGKLSITVVVLAPDDPYLGTVRSWGLAREVLARGKDLSKQAELMREEFLHLDKLDIDYVNTDTNSN